MQQDDHRAVRRAGLGVADVEDARLDLLQRGEGGVRAGSDGRHGGSGPTSRLVRGGSGGRLVPQAGQRDRRRAGAQADSLAESTPLDHLKSSVVRFSGDRSAPGNARELAKGVPCAGQWCTGRSSRGWAGGTHVRPRQKRTHPSLDGTTRTATPPSRAPHVRPTPEAKPQVAGRTAPRPPKPDPPVVGTGGGETRDPAHVRSTAGDIVMGLNKRRKDEVSKSDIDDYCLI